MVTTEPQANGHSRRILIVDDNDLNNQYLRTLLTRHNFQVDVASDGQGAIDAIRRRRPDVVLLDVQMPRVDGFGVLRALDGPAPLVIFVTAFDEHAVAAFNVHAFDYILKPVEPARFAEAIERARKEIERTTAAERHATPRPSSAHPPRPAARRDTACRTSPPPGSLFRTRRTPPRDHLRTRRKTANPRDSRVRKTDTACALTPRVRPPGRLVEA